MFKPSQSRSLECYIHDFTEWKNVLMTRTKINFFKHAKTEKSFDIRTFLQLDF